ncbi:MAG: glycosyltransferase family 4 protein [Patescibacteria group bacterium]
MKIAFIGQKGIPMKFGGVEKHVERLSVGLAELGHEVFVYTRPWYTSPKLRKYRGVNLISLNSWHRKNFDTITHTWRATWHALSRGYDVIHYHGVGPALLSFIPRLFCRKTRVVVTFHCLDREHAKWGILAKFFLRLGEWSAVYFPHETITVSKNLQHYVSKKYHVRTFYIPNGVDLVEKKSAREIKNFGLQKNNYILFLSRLIKHKGAHYLIQAFNSLKTDQKLVIAGASSFTDKYVDELQTLAKHNPNIIFTGNIKGDSRLWNELFANASLFVHPSESEGLPIVILEAMSFGLPVLASDIKENMEALHGGFGFSFKNKNAHDLREKMEYLLHNPKLCQEVGASARQHVSKNYNWSNIVKSVDALYREICFEKKALRSLKVKKQLSN